MPQYLVGPTRTYTTVLAALAAIPSDLLGTGIHSVIVDAGTYDMGTSAINITNSNGSSADHIELTCAVGSEHLGSISAGVILKTSGSSACLSCTSTNFRMSNLNVWGTANSSIGVRLIATGIVAENIISRFGVGGVGYQSSGVVRFYKCLAIEGGTGGFGSGWTASDYIAYNCGAYNVFTGFFGNSGVSANPICINCWASAGICFRLGPGPFNALSQNNASSDSTAPGANSLINVTAAQFAFYSSASSNLHITDNSVLNGAGVSLASFFTTDIDNETIVTWQIGPDCPISVAQSCYTETYSYTLSTSSSPWNQVLGDTYRTGSHFSLTANDILFRIPFSPVQTDGWAFQCTLIFPQTIATQTTFYFFPPYGNFYNGFFPAIRVSATNQVTIGGAVFGANPTSTYGTFNGFSAGSITSSTPISFRFAFRGTGTKQTAATVTINGITYSSGWVNTGTPFVSYQSAQFGVQFDGINDTGSVERVGVYNIITRGALTNAQADNFIAGGSICGLLIPDVYQPTSSTPYKGRQGAHIRVPDAKKPSVRIQNSEASNKANSTSKKTEAKPPFINTQSLGRSKGFNHKKVDRVDSNPAFKKIKAGAENGYISVTPNLAPYGGTARYGSGMRVYAEKESLGVGARYSKLDLAGFKRTTNFRTQLPPLPRGEFTFSPRSNDILAPLMSHFQVRHGSALSGGTTYYEFVPTQSTPTFGTNYGTGTYGNHGDLFTVNVTKLVNGSAIRFEQGICDTLDWAFSSDNDFNLTPSYRFKRASIIGSSLATNTGSYSTLPAYSGFNCTIDFMGISPIDFSMTSNNNLEDYSPLGGTTNYFKFKNYSIEGKATVDLSKVSLAYLGSMLGTRSFSISGTLYNDERDKVVFQLPNCRMDNFSIPMDKTKITIPFKAYEPDSVAAPIKVMVWTRNYSGTSFEPN